MNELQMIRALLDETPSEQTVAEGRERLRAAARSPRRVWRRPAPLWTVGTGLVAATAAAALTIALSGGTTARAPDGTESGRGEAPLNTRNVLLAAAQRAETMPDAGTYWHVKLMYALPTRVGPKNNPYWMNRLQIRETWTRSDGRSWTGYREVGARPRTPADAKAWQRDGSPAKWDLGPGDTVDRKHLFLYTAPQPGSLSKPDQSRSFVVCDKRLDFKRVRTLPYALTTLKDAIAKAERGNDDRPVPPSYQGEFLKQCLARLLVDVPVTPRVRAAVYRALADLPGVHVVGRVKDEQGRSGVRIVLDPKAGAPEIQLVIDTRTSLVLSEHTGRQPVEEKNRKTVYLQVGWTNSAPKVPTVP